MKGRSLCFFEFQTTSVSCYHVFGLPFSYIMQQQALESNIDSFPLTKEMLIEHQIEKIGVH